MSPALLCSQLGRSTEACKVDESEKRQVIEPPNERKKRSARRRKPKSTETSKLGTVRLLLIIAAGAFIPLLFMVFVALPCVIICGVFIGGTLLLEQHNSNWFAGQSSVLFGLVLMGITLATCYGVVRFRNRLVLVPDMGGGLINWVLAVLCCFFVAISVLLGTPDLVDVLNERFGSREVRQMMIRDVDVSCSTSSRRGATRTSCATYVTFADNFSTWRIKQRRTIGNCCSGGNRMEIDVQRSIFGESLVSMRTVGAGPNH